MKKLLFVLSYTVMSNFCAQEKTEYYPDGKMSSKGMLKDNVRTGEWIFYHKNGEINGKVAYDKNGQPIPETFHTFNESGEILKSSCQKPTDLQFSYLCSEIYARKLALNPSSAIGFQYQELLWEISCAQPGVDKLEIARIKIQIMWNSYRKLMRCYKYPTLQSSERNIAKFSLDTGFTTFISEAVNRYKLDMNFTDPGDNLTVLDWIKETEEKIRNSSPVDQSKADEYQRTYQLLKKSGAKHNWELNK